MRLLRAFVLLLALAAFAPSASALCPIDCHDVNPTLPSEECGDCVGVQGYVALDPTCSTCLYYVTFDVQAGDGEATAHVQRCHGNEAIVCYDVVNL